MKYMVAVWHLLVCSVVGFCLASILQTQVVLAKLSAVDVVIDIPARFSMTISDIIGLAPKYGGAILLTLALAFAIAKLINQKLTVSRYLLYPLAGALGFYIMLIAMYSLLNATIIGGARGAIGQILQISAGLISGFLFARLRENVQQGGANVER